MKASVFLIDHVCQRLHPVFSSQSPVELWLGSFIGYIRQNDQICGPDRHENSLQHRTLSGACQHTRDTDWEGSYVTYRHPKVTRVGSEAVRYRWSANIRKVLTENPSLDGTCACCCLYILNVLIRLPGADEIKEAPDWSAGLNWGKLDAASGPSQAVGGSHWLPSSASDSHLHHVEAAFSKGRSLSSVKKQRG